MKQVTFFSDSTTLLWWLRTTSPLSIYVANRVCQILDHTELWQWRHVRTNENPADIPTRGSNPTALRESKLWWKGPPFLRQPRKMCPVQPYIFPTLEANQEEDSLREIISNLSFLTSERDKPRYEPAGAGLASLVDRYESLNNGIRIATRVWAFLCLRLRVGSYPPAHLKKLIQLRLVCYDQSKTLQSVVTDLARCGRVSYSLVPLRPFLGPEGELRSNSKLISLGQLDPEARQPIILAPNSKLATEILRDLHCKQLQHCGGVGTLLAKASQNYHLIGGRAKAREVCQNCSWCQRRHNPKPLEIVEPPLHPNRGGLKLRPFAETGVDMTGPFWIKHGKTRARIKMYVILFVCCATRAINIEAVEEASSKKL